MSRRNLAQPIADHLRVISDFLGLEGLEEPVRACLAGGVAVDYWTGEGMSDELDIWWSRRIAVPSGMQTFEIPDPEDPLGWNLMTMDGGFSDFQGSFPPDWQARSPEIAVAGGIAIHVMDPVDLAVSRIARFEVSDRVDIRQLAAAGLVDIGRFEERAGEAIDLYVGDATFVRRQLQAALELVREGINDPRP